MGKIVNKYKKKKTIQRLPNSGRNKVLDYDDLGILLSEVEKNPRTSAEKLSIVLENSKGKKVCKQTIRNYLYSEDIHGRTSAKKPFISPKNQSKRFSLPNDWVFLQNSYWKSVIWSDECKFNVFGSDGKVTVWRKKNTRFEKKNVSPTVKYGGGSVMVWACFSSNGIGNMVFIDGKMDSLVYVRIIRENIDDSARKMGLGEFVFQQDNDPKHT